MTFHEDDSRIRQGHREENLSRMRGMALNLLKQEKTCKRGLAGRVLLIGWHNDYLLKVFGVKN